MANNAFKRLIYVFLAILLGGFRLNSVFADDWKQRFVSMLKNGSVLVVNDSNSVLLQSKADQGMLPASTLKVPTTFCALETLGADYRFTTSFYLDKLGRLFIKGSGDPSLISEEIEVIAQELAKKVSRVNEIIIDDSAFATPLALRYER